MKHGRKMENLYETMPDKNVTIYPHVEVPYEVISDKKLKPGDKIRVELMIEVQSITQFAVSGNLLESEIESKDEKKEGE